MPSLIRLDFGTGPGIVRTGLSQSSTATGRVNATRERGAGVRTGCGRGPSNSRERGEGVRAGCGRGPTDSSERGESVLAVRGRNSCPIDSRE